MPRYSFRYLRFLLLFALLAGGCAKDRYAGPPVSVGHERAAFRVAPEAAGYPGVLFGVPRTEAPVEVLANTAYTAGYSSETRTPLWVAYRLDEDTPFDPAPRLSRFLRDERVADPVTHADYTNSGYDRGHLAPSAPIGRRHGPEAQRETYRMTNIVPQLPGLNQRGWEAVESILDLEWSREFRGVWVFTGPIFAGDCIELESDVRVPSHCYMIVVDIDETNGEVHALGIVMEQRRIDHEPLAAFSTTVDAIEAATGIDFLHELEDEIETLVEAAVPDARWDIDRSLEPSFPGTHRDLRHRPCD